MAPASISVSENAAPPALALLPAISVCPYMSLVPFKLLPLHWSPEGVILGISLCVGPLKETAWYPRSFCLPQPQPLLVFIVTNYGDFLFWHLNPELEFLCGAGIPCSLGKRVLQSWDIPPNFFLPHVGVGSAHSLSLSPLPVLMWFLL